MQPRNQLTIDANTLESTAEDILPIISSKYEHSASALLKTAEIPKILVIFTPKSPQLHPPTSSRLPTKSHSILGQYLPGLSIMSALSLAPIVGLQVSHRWRGCGIFGSSRSPSSLFWSFGPRYSFFHSVFCTDPAMRKTRSHLPHVAVIIGFMVAIPHYLGSMLRVYM